MRPPLLDTAGGSPQLLSSSPDISPSSRDFADLSPSPRSPRGYKIMKSVVRLNGTVSSKGYERAPPPMEPANRFLSPKEIFSEARKALKDPGSIDSPISLGRTFSWQKTTHVSSPVSPIATPRSSFMTAVPEDSSPGFAASIYKEAKTFVTTVDFVQQEEESKQRRQELNESLKDLPAMKKSFKMTEKGGKND